jgi:tRNA-dihydrouridine synthase A
MKAAFPDLWIGINGGIASLDEARALLAQGVDGVMIGRAAYHDPAHVLAGADALWGEDHAPSPVEVALAMRPRIAAHVAAGGRMHAITRHMLGLFHGRPGARAWRRILSEQGPRGGLAAYDAALGQAMRAAA